jgi:hypothetical protein
LYQYEDESVGAPDVILQTAKKELMKNGKFVQYENEQDLNEGFL